MATLVIQPYRLSAARKLAYQYQDSDLTLADALEQYYRENECVVKRPQLLQGKSTQLFASHDICHVIFGLDTSLADEMVADIRTSVACRLTWREQRERFTNADALAVFRQLGVWRAVSVPLRSLPRIFRVAIQSIAMKKRWPWTPPDSYLERRLNDLRSEYGIKIV
jgi:hypothetical protein